MGWLDILILAVIAVLVVLAIRYAVRNHNACDGCCADCPYRRRGKFRPVFHRGIRCRYYLEEHRKGTAPQKGKNQK